MRPKHLSAKSSVRDRNGWFNVAAFEVWSVPRADRPIQICGYSAKPGSIAPVMINLTAGDARLLHNCLGAALKAHRKMETTVVTVKTKAQSAESPVGEPAAPLFLTERELATMLHALRVVQRGVGDEAEACDHFYDVNQLTNTEIEDLCERINTGPYPALMATPKKESLP